MLLVPVPIISGPHAAIYIYTFPKVPGWTDLTSCPCLAAIWPASALLWEAISENRRVEWGGEICCHFNICFPGFVCLCRVFFFLNEFLYLVHRSSVVPNCITLNDQLGYSFLYNIHQIYSNGKKRKQNERFFFFFFLQRKKKNSIWL